MHLSIQFRHKATSTVSGEIETVSDCAEATHSLQQNNRLQTSHGLTFFLMSFLSSLLTEALTSCFDRRITFEFLASSVLFSFSLLSGLCLQIIWVVQVLPRRGHLLSSLLGTLGTAAGRATGENRPNEDIIVKNKHLPTKQNKMEFLIYTQIVTKFADC